MSGMHFERMGAEYADARPPYPGELFDLLETVGAIGPARSLLEVGAGAGLATSELVRRGCDVVAVEPGVELSRLLTRRSPGTPVLTQRLEDAVLPDAGFDTVAAATSLHWVDLELVLPRLHATLRPGGWLAVWRTLFGDSEVRTDFRDRVDRIVARRSTSEPAGRELRPTMAELAAGGWFVPVRSERWRWSIDLGTDQVRRLFATFSNWSATEVEAAAAAAQELGGTVTEHYQSVLHLLRRKPV